MISFEEFFASIWEIEKNLTKKMFSLQKYLENLNRSPINITGGNKESNKAKKLLGEVEEILDQLNYHKRTIEGKQDSQKKAIIRSLTDDNIKINEKFNILKNPQESPEFYVSKPNRSVSQSNLLKAGDRTFEIGNSRNNTQFEFESAEKRTKTQTFLENTFNSKIAKKLTLESQESIKSKKKLQPELKNRCDQSKNFKRKTFVDELNQEWIENLMKEFEEDKSKEKTLGKKDSAKKENGKNDSAFFQRKKETVAVSERVSKESNNFPSAFEVIGKEIEFVRKNMINLIEDLDKHKHVEEEGELEKLRMENNRIKRKYREITEENHEILERINEISDFKFIVIVSKFIKEKQLEEDFKTNQELWNEFLVLKAQLRR